MVGIFWETLGRFRVGSKRSGSNPNGHRAQQTDLRWRIKGEYARLLFVVLRTCTVAVKDIRDVEHSIEVTAETLYEAIATALAALQQDNWVGESGSRP